MKKQHKNYRHKGRKHSKDCNHCKAVIGNHYCLGRKLSLNHRKKISDWSKMPRKKRIIVFCKLCKRKISKTELDKIMFCNKACHNKWKSINQVGKNNPNYGNGEKIRGKNNPMTNPVYKERAIRNLFIALKVKPNKQEYELLKLINKLKLPFLYNFGNIIVGGKIPDFYCIKNKKLIEYNGRYWHRNDKGEKQKLYKKLGYECLVIWEEELKNIELLKEKLTNYAKR